MCRPCPLDLVVRLVLIVRDLQDTHIQYLAGDHRVLRAGQALQGHRRRDREPVTREGAHPRPALV